MQVVIHTPGVDQTRARPAGDRAEGSGKVLLGYRPAVTGRW